MSRADPLSFPDVAEAVADAHVGVKGLALQGQLLPDLKLHPRTDRIIHRKGRRSKNQYGKKDECTERN